MKKYLFLLACMGVAFAGDIEISDSFVKQTPPNIKQTAIFMNIKNNSDKNINLIDANTSLSDITELHTHIKDGEMMKMIKVEKIEVPAGGVAELKSGGLHIMIFELKNKVDENTTAAVTLKFDNGEEIFVDNIKSKKIQKPMMKH